MNKTLQCTLSIVERLSDASTTSFICKEASKWWDLVVPHTLTDMTYNLNGKTINLVGNVLKDGLFSVTDVLANKSMTRRGRNLMIGKKSILAVIINFYSQTPLLPISNQLEQQVNQTLFHPIEPSQKGFWDVCSYGKLQLDVEHSRVLTVDVPFVCDMNDSLCPWTYNSLASCSSDEIFGWPQYVFNKLKKEQVDFTEQSFDHWMFIHPTDTIRCNYIGQATIGCNSHFCHSWISWNYASQVSLYAHELGHNFELLHAGLTPTYRPTLNEMEEEYGDLSCTMGFCCSLRCFNGPHSYSLGWTEPMITLDETTISLHEWTDVRLYSHSKTTNALVRINLNWLDTMENLWIEFRTEDGYDKGMNRNWLNKVHIKSWPGLSFHKTKHVWKGSPGDVWTDGERELLVFIREINVEENYVELSLTRNLSKEKKHNQATKTKAPFMVNTLLTCFYFITYCFRQRLL